MSNREGLEELRHQLLNGAVSIAGCLKSIEAILKNMSDALDKFEEAMKGIYDE